MTSHRPRISTGERQRLFTLHGGACHICGQPIDGVRQRWDVEHVIPRSLIGRSADTDDNMRPAHARCHAVKTSKDAGDLARAKRQQAHHQGAHRGRTAMPGSRDSSWKHRMDGRWERRHQPILEDA